MLTYLCPPAELLPTEVEWNHLVDLIKILHPFKIVMKRLEGENYSTVGWVPSMVSFLRKRLDDSSREFPSNDNSDSDREDNDVVEESLIEDFLPDLIMKMKKDFVARFGDGDARQYDGTINRGFLNRQIGIHPLIVIASALDPRFKALSCFWIQEDKDAIWKSLLDEMVNYAKSKNLFEDGDNDANNNTVSNKETESGNDKDELDDFLMDLDKNYGDDEILNDQGNNEEDGVNSVEDRIFCKCKKELNEYRKLKPSSIFIGDKSKFLCPLQDFWSKKEEDFPILSQLAKKYLCVQATSAPSERIFSIASRIISKFRNRLNPENAGTILFIYKMLNWYKTTSGDDI